MPILEIVHPFGLDLERESQIKILGLRQSLLGSETLKKQFREYRDSLSFIKRELRNEGFDLEFLQTRFPQLMWEAEKSAAWPDVPKEKSDGLVVARDPSKGRKSWLEALCLAIDKFRQEEGQRQTWSLLTNSFGLYLNEGKDGGIEAEIAGRKLLFGREPLTKDLAAIALVPKEFLDKILKEEALVVLTYPFVFTQGDIDQGDAHLCLKKGKGQTLKVEDISHLPYRLEEYKIDPKAFFFSIRFE